MQTTIQSVYFSKPWTTTAAEKWLKAHNLKPLKSVHRTANYLRYRIHHPSKFQQLRTKKLDQGIYLVFGIKRVL